MRPALTLAAALVLATCACSGPAAPAAAPTCAGPDPLVLTEADRAREFCLPVGGRLEVRLAGTLEAPWADPAADSDALTATPHGRQTLDPGVTGGYFTAKHAGTAQVSSTRPNCTPAQGTGCGTFTAKIRIP